MGDEAGFGQSWNRRDPRPGPCRDHSLPCRQFASVNTNPSTFEQGSFSPDDFDAHCAKAFRVVMAAHCLASGPHACHQGREVDARIGWGQAEVRPTPDIGHKPRRPDQRLARDATRPQAFTAESVALDQCDVRSKSSRSGRNGEARRPAAYDHNVEAFAHNGCDASFDYYSRAERG